MPTKYRRQIWSNNLHQDLRTSESPWSLKSLFAAFAGVGFVLVFVLAMFMLASAADEKAERDHQRLTQAEKVRQALPTKLAEAYERGMADAIESLRETPDGIALAQACLAQGVQR